MVVFQFATWNHRRLSATAATATEAERRAQNTGGSGGNGRAAQRRNAWIQGKGLMKNMVTASVRGRVGDDITQCQDDEGSVRNCSNLDMFYFWNKFLVQIPWKGHFKSGKSSVLQARN